ncbi:hypothetical protein HHI36_011517 [Cryptolaemus montrouzieri]|uniref:Major facilitator superfamily (MFS) profile domain-containing protein n=1 Tax=Cryptolaemus montrouzieri TaxID=559131 RepID=A0ABD2MM03_9CUCU
MTDAAVPQSSHRVYLIVFSTYLYSFTNEAAISWASPVLPELRKHNLDANPLGRRITENEESWLASLLHLGNMIGLLPYSYLCYKYGRKYTLASLGVLHVIAFLLFTTKNMTLFYIGRFLNGVAYGSGFILFPMYISEICQDNDRGFLVVSRQIFSSCGILFSYTAGNYLSLFWFNIILTIFPLIYVISFTILATESPYFHVMNQDVAAARNVIIQLTSVNNQQIDEDVDEMIKAVEMTQTENLTETLSYKPVQTAVILVYIMFIFQNLTGYMPMSTYAEIILKKVGTSAREGVIVIGILFLIGSTISTIFIDRKGRKLLLSISLIGVIFVNVIFSLYYFVFDYMRYLPIICLTLFFLSFNIGLALIPQIISAEILPISVRFKVASTAGFFGYGTAFLLTKSFLGLYAVIGGGWIMMFFAFCSVVFLILIILFLPETKGRSFRQIQSLLEVSLQL